MHILRLNRFPSVILSALLALAVPAALRGATPTLELTTTGGGATSLSIPQGTPTVTLAMRLDSDGLAVGSLLYHIVTTPASAVTYALTNPLVAKNAPFTIADLSNGLAPTPGATVQAGVAGSTQWVKSSAGDYAAIDGEIAWYTFNTQSLAATTYSFTPVGLELANDALSSNPIEVFAPAGSFVLTVVAVPEPSAMSCALVLAIVCGARARRSACERMR